MHKHARDNRSRQLNPKDTTYWSSRNQSPPPPATPPNTEPGSTPGTEAPSAPVKP